MTHRRNVANKGNDEKLRHIALSLLFELLHKATTFHRRGVVFPKGDSLEDASYQQNKCLYPRRT